MIKYTVYYWIANDLEYVIANLSARACEEYTTAWEAEWAVDELKSTGCSVYVHTEEVPHDTPICITRDVSNEEFQLVLKEYHASKTMR